MEVTWRPVAAPRQSWLRFFLEAPPDQPNLTPCAILGGFPLCLAGGAPHYNDIDIYTFDRPTFHYWHRYLSREAEWLHTTEYTTVFRYKGEEVQLVYPHPNQPTAESVLYNTDVTPSACQLTYTDNQWTVGLLYPDDIDNRLCRLLVEHDWTPYRAQTYQAKGYWVVRSDGSPYTPPAGWQPPGKIHKNS